jgi:cytochrome b6-f complex iron-sulfur subunit
VKINRRTMLKHTALVGAALAAQQTLPRAFAQNKFKSVKIGALEKLDKVYASMNFDFDGQKALLVRLPKPDKPSDRVLEINEGDETLYFTAYNLICTHAGCTVNSLNRDRQLDCPCHGSRFAADGAVVGGPARQSLRGIQLKLEDGMLVAFDYVAVK